MSFEPTQTSTFGVDGDAMAEAALERLQARGPVSKPAELLEMLPAGLDRGGSVRDDAMTQWILGELVKYDLALAADAGMIRGADFYVGRDAIWAAGAVPADVIDEADRVAGEQTISGGGPTPFGSSPVNPSPVNSSPGKASPGKASPGESSAAISLKPGDVIDDFEIIRRAGGGAFADVYQARQRSIGRVVALKVSDGEDRETGTLARMDHPGIVRVYDRKVIEHPPATLVYMQFHTGGTLADVISWRTATRDDSGGRVMLDCVDDRLFEFAQTPPERSESRTFLAGADWTRVSAWVGIRLCRALSHAHRRGVLHRDIKPANVLLTSEGVPRLADFNVSDDGDAHGIGGSLAYMPPEHLEVLTGRAGGRTGAKSAAPNSTSARDGRSDLYSLSVLLWELWTGVRPWGDAQSDRTDPVSPPSDGSEPGGELATVMPASGSISSVARAQLEHRRRATESIRKSLASGGRVDRDQRDKPCERDRHATASSRVLCEVLARGLETLPDDRFGDADAMEARLRLVMHPDAAGMFDPPPGSFRRWLLGLPIAAVALVVLLVPHLVLAFANYNYNRFVVMETTTLRADLDEASWVVNLAILPLAAVLAITYSRSIATSIAAIGRGRSARPDDIDATLDLGNRAAMIGSALWLTSGIVFPLLLSWISDEFTLRHAMHLLVSAIGCGGLAVVYPYFAMTALSGGVYYPRYLMATLTDDRFTDRRRRVERRGLMYMVAAAVLPMGVAAGLVAGLPASMSPASMSPASMSPASMLFGAMPTASVSSVLPMWAAVMCVLIIGAAAFPAVVAAHVWTLGVWRRLDEWISV